MSALCSDEHLEADWKWKPTHGKPNTFRDFTKPIVPWVYVSSGTIQPKKQLFCSTNHSFDTVFSHLPCTKAQATQLGRDRVNHPYPSSYTQLPLSLLSKLYMVGSQGLKNDPILHAGTTFTPFEFIYGRLARLSGLIKMAPVTQFQAESKHRLYTSA